MRLTAALALLWLSACVHAPAGLVRPLTAAEAASVDDARAAWDGAAVDLEAQGPECLEGRAALRLAIARDHREMFSMTGYCGPSGPQSSGEWEGDLWCRWGRASGAYRRAYDGGVWPFGLFQERPVLVLWGGHEPTPKWHRLIRHEAVHWLQECTGRGWNPWSPHDDAAVWCAEGCPGHFRRRVRRAE